MEFSKVLLQILFDDKVNELCLSRDFPAVFSDSIVISSIECQTNIIVVEKLTVEDVLGDIGDFVVLLSVESFHWINI